MDLLEYQAKELFRQVGIPILPSQTIQDPRQIKQLQIPYPVVLKSQVPSGGRGKAGGVRFVANTIDAIAAARTIFNLSILGEYPKVILAEAHYNTEQELFLAIVLDYQLKCPVLLGSSSGGMNVKSLLANLQQVAIEEQFSPFYARHLIAKMGLSQELMPSLSSIIQKMYYLFQAKDLDLIEINPLGINRQGELMALDGKITVNNSALARHPALEALKTTRDDSKSQEQSPIRIEWQDWREEQGQIAIICNSFDLVILTWDLIQQQGVKPACAVTIENQLVTETIPLDNYAQKLQQILTQLESESSLKVILVNIWESEAVSKKIMETINNYCQLFPQEVSKATEETQVMPNNGANFASHDGGTDQEPADLPLKQKSSVKFVLRLLDRGDWEQQQLKETVYLTTSIKSAVSQAIKLVKLNN